MITAEGRWLLKERVDTHHTVEAATLTRVGWIFAFYSYSLMGFFPLLQAQAFLVTQTVYFLMAQEFLRGS